ncbi:MAG: hypothetical protein ACYCQI_15065 [Gammaproteobacteria bacterium]
MQRLVIKKAYLSNPQQLPEELKELKQPVDVNAVSIEKAKANLKQLVEQKAHLETQKGHAEIIKLTQSEIPTLTQSIATRTKNIEEYSTRYKEAYHACEKLGEEVHEIHEQKYSCDYVLYQYDHWKSEFDKEFAKAKQLKQEIDSIKIPEQLRMVTVIDRAGNAHAIVEDGEEIIAKSKRAQEIAKEMEESLKKGEQIKIILEGKKGPFHFKDKTLTLAEVREEFKRLKQQEEEQLNKLSAAEDKAYRLKRVIDESQQSIKAEQYRLTQCTAKVATLTQQYGSPAAKEFNLDELNKQIAIINGQIRFTENAINQLGIPSQQYDAKKAFHDQLVSDELYQKLINDPSALLEELAQKAQKYWISGLTACAEFQRSFDEISSEDDLPSAVNARRLALQEKCFQLIYLIPYCELYPESSSDFCREDCEAAYASLLKKLNPDHPVSFFSYESEQVRNKLFDEALMNFNKVLEPFAPAINQCKQTKKLYAQVKELSTIGKLEKDDLELCASVLRTATFRIKNPANEKYKTKLDDLAKTTASEQPNPKLANRGKIVAIVGAVILLTSIIAISVLTYGVATPATIPLAAKVTAYIGIAAGTIGLFGGYKINRNAQAKGTTKKTLEANNAISQLHSKNFFR